jgi:hypothetical protein
LAKLRLQTRADRSRHDIDAAARREPDEEGDGAVRKFLRHGAGNPDEKRREYWSENPW